ncbi:MAG: Holliday junction branch migration protein RuvA [Desulfitobacteriaceae bacterium]|nr:Holliday junction branch migration protein RuvA [Desulfitobacteriaceae bacterium]MDD4751852.1 Holliday junction branch migration protein RuvA [Desulfitobacteriaceae bacterium]
MIAFIKGNVFSLDGENIIVDIGGIGYHVLVPPMSFKEKPKIGEEIFLHTYLQVREDGWQLFGFPEREQLEVFRELISVSGIGARLGLATLNHLSSREVVQAVLAGDSGKLNSVPGIGKKIAQRLVLELKEKFKKLSSYEMIDVSHDEEEPNYSNQDVIDALTQLGYSSLEARTAFLKASRSLGQEAESEELIKGALKLLAKF